MDARPSVLLQFTPLETSAHSPAAEDQRPEFEPGVQGSQAQHRLFGKHWSDRTRILLALHRSDVAWLQKRASRMDWCRHSPQLTKDANGKPSLWFEKCKDRLCPLCQLDRGRIAATRISALVTGWPSCRFATLTLKHREEPLQDTLDRLHECFRQIRRLKYWREHVRSGVWSIEVTRNLNLGTWHVHIHILFHGDYLPQAKLSSMWEEVTGDSKIVDIRAVHNRETTANYVAEYVAKPFNVSAWQPDDIVEYAKAMHGRRLIHTFGKAHKAAIDPGESEPAEPANDIVGPLAHVNKAAAMGCDNARHAMEILRRMGPMFAHASGQEQQLPGLPRMPVEQWERDIVVACVTRLTALAMDGHDLYTPPEPERYGIGWAVEREQAQLSYTP